MPTSVAWGELSSHPHLVAGRVGQCGAIEAQSDPMYKNLGSEVKSLGAPQVHAFFSESRVLGSRSTSTTFSKLRVSPQNHNFFPFVCF